MGYAVLIAEPTELTRIGLKTIFAGDRRVSHIYEAATGGCLETQLRHYAVDLVIANQLLVTDVALLPKGKFVILTAKPDMITLRTIYRQKGCGYLSVNVSAKLLLTVLDHRENAFLLEPVLAPWIMDRLFGDAFVSLQEELLTPREREIINLLRLGLDRTTIAENLCIAETTLKTHIKNIMHKRKLQRK